MFDIFENDYGIGPELVLNFDEEGSDQINDEIRQQVKDLSYESHNVVKNLGTLVIGIIFYFFSLVALLLVLITAQALKKNKMGAPLKEFYIK